MQLYIFFGKKKKKKKHKFNRLCVMITHLKIISLLFSLVS